MANVIYELPDKLGDFPLPADLPPEEVRRRVDAEIDVRIKQRAQQALQGPENPIMAAYKAVAGPVTSAVGKVINPAAHFLTEPLVTATRIAQEGSLKPLVQEKSPMASAQPFSDELAKLIVPQTPAQLGMMAVTPMARGIAPAMGLAKPMGAILGGALGGGAGAAISGENVPANAALGAGGAAFGEAVGAAAQAGRKILPGAKAAINQQNSQEVAEAMVAVNPALGQALQNISGTVESTLKGGTTAATIKRALFGGELQREASKRMDMAVTAVDAAARHPLIQGQALDRAYAAMPQIAQDYLVGQVSGGYTLKQAQAIRAWVGSNAFAQSPLGQGVGKVPQQMLWGDMTREIEAPLRGPALKLWQTANHEYGGAMVMQEALEHAFQGMPNRIMLNRNAISEYISKNQEDITRRLGSAQAFQDFSRRVLSGAEPGTRDILAPGAGTATTALRQVYGRGQGGAPQIVGSALRTVAPNIGSEYTGTAPMQIPGAVRAGLDVVSQRAASEIPEEQAQTLRELLNFLP